MPLVGSQKSQPDHASPVKIPIILAKNEKSGASGEMRTAGKLWKPAGDSEIRLATSPKHSIPTLLQSGELPSHSPSPSPTPSQQPSYKIQQRNDVKPLPDSDWTKSTSQTSSVKLIDECMSWCSDSLTGFLLEQNEYRVVGILGMEGVGKTYIMNLLANHPNQATSSPFKVDKVNSEPATHTTTGMNAFVTSERIILLDCQPIFSSSVLDNFQYNERKFNYNGELSSGEDACDATNMELTMFMLSVCHIVIIAENWFTDPNLHRILQSVEVLKPPQLSNEKLDDHPEFTSRIMFVQNMCSADDPDSYDANIMEQSLTNIYSSSLLRLHRHKSTGNVKIVPLALNKAADDAGSASICAKLEQRFVQDVMSMHIYPVVNHTTLSEKNWYQYASKLWDAVKKSPFISEYIRLLMIM